MKKKEVKGEVQAESHINKHPVRHRMNIGKLYFVTTNDNKFREVQEILKPFGILITHKKQDLLEIQCRHTDTVAQVKAGDAYSRFMNPVLVEDTGIFINSLSGFPGVYSAYAYKTMGLEGFMRLMKGVKDRSVVFSTSVAFKPDSHRGFVFRGEMEGRIAQRLSGEHWGYDPLFIPKGFSKTYAEMKPDEKNAISHRKKAFEAFAKFFNEHYCQDFRG